MQPNPEAYTVNRRPMDVADFIDVIRRHRGWIIGPAFAGLVISVVVAFLWPDSYISDGTIRIVPPTVPERYVPSNVNLQLGQRIAAMEQQVRGRSNILNLVTKFALYPRKRGRVPDEDLIEDMQRDITIRAVAALRDVAGGQSATTAFRVSFRYSDRYLAQQVVREIITMFQNETLTSRSLSSTMTTDFLKEQVDAAKKNLDEMENQLTAFKMKYRGRLPDELNNNLAALRTFDTQLASADAAISRLTQEKLLMENNLRVAKEQYDAVPASPTASMEVAVKNERLITLERQILAQENGLAAMRQRYSGSHPDVRQAEAQLASLQKSKAALLDEEQKKAAPAAKPDTTALTREQRLAQGEMEKYQGLIQAKEMEIERAAGERTRVNGLIKEYQGRIQASPLSERDYAQLTRDYQLAKDRY